MKCQKQKCRHLLPCIGNHELVVTHMPGGACICCGLVIGSGEPSIIDICEPSNRLDQSPDMPMASLTGKAAVTGRYWETGTPLLVVGAYMSCMGGGGGGTMESGWPSGSDGPAGMAGWVRMLGGEFDTRDLDGAGKSSDLKLRRR